VAGPPVRPGRQGVAPHVPARPGRLQRALRCSASCCGP
jgi:hypothetical protein